jgi:hypothetical protein
MEGRGGGEAQGVADPKKRTRRIMNLCMQDDQIGPNIVGLSPADMTRLPLSIITKILLVVDNQVCQLGLHLL